MEILYLVRMVKGSLGKTLETFLSKKKKFTHSHLRFPCIYPKDNGGHQWISFLVLLSLLMFIPPSIISFIKHNNLIRNYICQIARELRLRDIGGIIVVDFIDMHDDGKLWNPYSSLQPKECYSTCQCPAYCEIVSCLAQFSKVVALPVQWLSIDFYLFVLSEFNVKYIQLTLSLYATIISPQL